MEKNLISNLYSLPIYLPDNDYFQQSLTFEEKNFNYSYISSNLLNDIKVDRQFNNKYYYDLNEINNPNNVDNEKLINIMFKEKKDYEDDESQNKEDDIKTKNEACLINLKKDNNEIIDNKNKEVLYIDFKISEQEKIFNDIIKECNKKEKNNSKFLNIKKGRKNKNDINKGNHTKFSEDNIMRKIKAYFGNSVHKLINESLKGDNIKLIKLNTIVNEKLKKEYNIKLWNTTLKELYLNSKISPRYKDLIKRGFDNKDLIKIIYEKIYENDAAKILNLTYGEMFKIFRKKYCYINNNLKEKIKHIKILNNNGDFNDLKCFLNEVFIKEKIKGEKDDVINKYLTQVKYLCLHFEKWFSKKKGRLTTEIK